MGFIFDKNLASDYEEWYNSSHGKAIDRSIEKLILSMLGFGSGERVLDIGCGTGNHLMTFKMLGYNVTGIDASPFMINCAKSRIGDKCSLKIGLAEDLPFEDNEFDIAVLINTLEFIDNPLKALAEAGRVANRKIFIGVFNSLSWDRLFGKFQIYPTNKLFKHARFYNLWQIKSLLNRALGPVSITWGCINPKMPIVKGTGHLDKILTKFQPSPFGTFLGISASIMYRFKTENLSVKDIQKEPKQYIVGINSSHFKKDAKTGNENERSQPL